MKAAAWDVIGSLFWELGRPSARPSQGEIEEFLAELPAGGACTVVGASTKELVEAVVAAGLRATVLDFSQRMCSDLEAALAPGFCEIRQHDITHEPPKDLAGSQSAVLSDRLLNRFDGAEAATAIAGMAGLLAPGGELRTSVKLGFYPMDLRMIELGRERGCLHEFYDEESRVLDFSAAGAVIEDAVLPHGEIPRDLLLEWYRGRGREKRFKDEEVRMLPTLAGVPLELRLAREVPDSPETSMYVWQLPA